MLKVFVIGSGPIVIGQAAEFDYSGTQAIKALNEHGHKVILLNNNPATIMTDLDLVDTLYSEPMTVESCIEIIEAEAPDAIVLGMGGQTSLNLGIKLYDAGILEKHKIKILGTHPEDIKRAEDREIFRDEMLVIDEPVITSHSVTTLEDALVAAEKIGYPIIVRPAFTLGGFGGGICDNPEELKVIAYEGLKKSPVGQVLIEKSVYGWKEIEYEMMRDQFGNTIAVCNMENMDPVGIHTGDSIVVAPSQTLNDRQYQMLRQSAIQIVNHLNIIGGCNVQYALSPTDNRYYVIEVNPRVSRSSALASKATGYAIANIAMKIGLGFALDEIENQVTMKTKACHEPTLDYCVVKMPRWPYDKLNSSNTKLGTVMRATGEVMAIGTTFEESLLKAIRSLDMTQHDLFDLSQYKLTTEELFKKCIDKEFDRIFALAELIRRNTSDDEIHERTHIDLFFIKRLKRIIELENQLKQAKSLDELSSDQIKLIKRLGFSNMSIANIGGWPLQEVEARIALEKIVPSYRMVDTCGGEFEAYSNYLYSTYHGKNESVVSDKKKIIVIGSGPIRIGQGVEFDYSSVKALLAIRKLGYEAIMINNNPETVSTDYDLSDKLYFEPLTFEDVKAIIDLEKPHGVMLQFGGQTAIKLANKLEEAGVNLLGLSTETIDKVEDRALFYEMLDTLGIPRAAGGIAINAEMAKVSANKMGYPVLLRPSFVIGGQDMMIIRDDQALEAYFETMKTKYLKPEILVDKYLEGVELEIDALSDGVNVFIPGMMEHLDQAGVHSGDSITLYPANLTKKQTIKLYDYIESICRHLNYKGIINFQFVKYTNELYVLEVNPRASRSVPFIAKVTRTPLIYWAVGLSLGSHLNELGLTCGLMATMPYAAVKAPVFSNEKLIGIDSILGPNMLSTGESMFIGKTMTEALDKLLVADRIDLKSIRMLMHTSQTDDAKYQAAVVSKDFEHDSVKVGSNHLTKEELLDIIEKNDINLIVETNDFTSGITETGQALRQLAVERGIPVVLSPDKFSLIINHLEKGVQSVSAYALHAKAIS
ncbi:MULTISPECIES: carbamoyl-phosphate synthase (glutamine-hydrolyzing) large subunit [unclassified Fusibacter]|uniref:carbamoyl-phosphate synthase (glutamine-hydrolyzing) large subunit n=1 Tax=unclassified Fusibacter TaxID=2624464 RepID=UPI0010124EE8|nr:MULTISPECIES: carbamoyl-phosphate synthase (glutamine-hydrolyzing) large subunit [unclassified Fusibacter]MCK8061167.1 carbamoyl-phosphate synthase (glutamine-hydrolyzing) large subunit [Fusibacter sp. A2]NPE23296.1 carbamoyl-phosphate synthase (glutamine-hydrolyzing) large subunit [Fusibacter sp. A1]RXV59338.1 carbamoyl-phosphate synthase (glutamine-hydrolyzing) large subunit [Fusibacter sp. A1]